MSTPKHAKPYDPWLDECFTEALEEFESATGHRPEWAIGRHEKPRDPFFPLDREWVKP